MKIDENDTAARSRTETKIPHDQARLFSTGIT